MKEEFLPIEGYGDFIKSRYEISNFGRVRSLYERSWGRKTKDPDRILSSHIKKSGGIYVSLLTGEKFPRLKAVHISTLVAQHFIPNPDPEHLTTVDYIDGNKENLRADNLKWVPRIPNRTDSARYIYSYEWIAPNGVFKFEKIREFRQFYLQMRSEKKITAPYYSLFNGKIDPSGGYFKKIKVRK